jgi:SAM-dependent methyltransferase
LKVPVDAGEEDLIFEYLNVLVSRPEVGRELGARARRWVESEYSWDNVASRYVAFLDAVRTGRQWPAERTAVAEPEPVAVAVSAQAAASHEVPAQYISNWAQDRESREYLDTHQTRLEKTLAITPPGTADDRVLEMGAYLQITPALATRLGYGTVRGCYYGTPGHVDRRRVVSSEGETFECEIDHFDAEKDPFPYPDDYFATVLCCELIEHLREDPMHLMSEVNRILKPGGSLVLTTPNIASLHGISAILQGYHPGLFHAYIRPRADGETEARHNREYAPREVMQLLECAGFRVTLLETGPFHDLPRPEDGWVQHLLERYNFDTALRGAGIYAVGQKIGTIRERYPSWLYN